MEDQREISATLELTEYEHQMIIDIWRASNRWDGQHPYKTEERSRKEMLFISRILDSLTELESKTKGE